MKVSIRELFVCRTTPPTHLPPRGTPDFLQANRKPRKAITPPPSAVEGCMCVLCSNVARTYFGVAIARATVHSGGCTPFLYTPLRLLRLFSPPSMVFHDFPWFSMVFREEPIGFNGRPRGGGVDRTGVLRGDPVDLPWGSKKFHGGPGRHKEASRLLSV